MNGPVDADILEGTALVLKVLIEHQGVNLPPYIYGLLPRNAPTDSLPTWLPFSNTGG